MMRSYVTFKDEVPSGGVSNQLSHEYEGLSGAAIFNMKCLIGRVDTDPVVHASKSLPFLVQTLDIGVRPVFAALVNNMWRSSTPEEVLAIFLVELRNLEEVQLKRPMRNVVLTNMGAGYFDVAISATAGVSQIKALAGSTVGGEDTKIQ